MSEQETYEQKIERLKPFMRRVINAFEMGKTSVDYDALYIYKDGPGGTRQLTVSFGLTSSGNLKTFVQDYIKAGGMFASQFEPFLPLIKKSSIVDNLKFKMLLQRAAREDQVYRDTMDDIYYRLYFNPALQWCEQNGFVQPLSILVILDSFIHSGSILASLRSKFSEVPPIKGGRERIWIEQYLKARESWLRNHSRRILNATAVRPRTFLKEIERGNWDLEIRPIMCNGVKVF